MTTKTVEIAEPTKYELLVEKMREKHALGPVFQFIKRTVPADEIMTFREALVLITTIALKSLGWHDPKDGHGFKITYDDSRSRSARMLHGTLCVTIDQWQIHIPIEYYHVFGGDEFRLTADGNAKVFNASNSVSEVAEFFDGLMSAHIGDVMVQGSSYRTASE